MVEYEGKQYHRDKRDKYRCPNRCGSPDYPQPSWSSDKGFLKHLAQCSPAMPKPLFIAIPVQREKFADCPDCGATIWKMTSYWEMRNAFVCIGCYLPYHQQGNGFHSCAGLDIPALALEG